jgi:hypothetical protein
MPREPQLVAIRCPAAVFGGRAYTFSVTGDAVEMDELTWALDHDGLLLAHGRPGVGPRAVLVGFPDVRVRTPMVLSLYREDGGLRHRVAQRSLVVVPPRLTPLTLDGMADLEVAVYDATGTVECVLTRSQARFRTVTQRFALDFFGGDLLLIGPDMLANGADGLLGSLEGRSRRGLQVILLPQSRPWNAAGIQHVLRPRGDGSGVITTTPEFESIPLSPPGGLDGIWVVEERAGAQPSPDIEPLITLGDPPRILAARVPVGAGNLWALTLPQCRNVDDEAEGLLVLDHTLRLAVASVHERTSTDTDRK